MWHGLTTAQWIAYGVGMVSVAGLCCLLWRLP